jgi:F0F1-type ATP synthase membrane subunit b/b'
MTDLDRFNYIKRQIETRKQEIAQNQGAINMVKKQLKEMGINSKKELDEALSKAEAEYKAAYEDYHAKLNRFEEMYKDFFRRDA